MFLTHHDEGSAPAQPAIEETTSVESLVRRRSGPGMLVLAPPVRVIHVNQAAWDLVQRMRGEDQGQDSGDPGTAEGLLPAPLRLLCLEVMKHLRDRPHAKDWERFESKRLMGPSSGPPVLVRAFGIPDGGQVERSRVVLFLEEVGRRRETVRKDAKDSAERFQLTTRELSVVQCLAKGWTNKEVAAALGLALATVKEHIRHLMEKTSTSTRTGILVKIFHEHE